MSTTLCTVCMLSVSPMLFDARIQREAKSLRDAGYDVTIIYVEDKQSLSNIPNIERVWNSYQREMHNIHTKQVFLRSREWKWLPKYICKFLQAVELLLKFSWMVTIHRAEVYHGHDLTPGIFCILGKLLHRAKIVYDAHELELQAKNPFGLALQRFYEKFLIRCSDAVITVNEPIATIMNSQYKRRIDIIANRTEYIPVDCLRVKLLRHTIDLPIQTKIIMYVGYVTPNTRGIEQVFKALSLLSEDIIFLIMGVGRLESFKNYTMGKIKQLNINPQRVQFIGPFPPDQVVHYLSGADISVALYQSNLSQNNQLNAPNKIFQSIMAQVPVLASNNETFPQFIHNNGVGSIGELVDENNPREIADKVVQMLQTECQMQYRKHTEILARKYSWQSEAQKLINLYASLQQ